MPSDPCTTKARLAPSAASVRPTRSTRLGASTPMTCARAPAGFVSGPQRLKIVRKPSALRSEPHRLHRRMIERREEKHEARLAQALDGQFRASVMGTPSASKTSAAPHRDVTARLPCLATLAPAAAATSAAPEEILKVSGPPPPVPHVSTSSARSSSVSGTPIARARITSTKPASSGACSPRVASTVSSAAVSTSGSLRPPKSLPAQRPPARGSRPCRPLPAASSDPSIRSSLIW